VNGRGGGEDLARLIERSAELKRDLVDFACSPRLERALAAAMLEAGLEELEEADAIGTIDRFVLQYRLPGGRTVVDRSWRAGRIWMRRTGRCCSAGATRWRGSSRSEATTATRSSC
jgi:hypothetical protein